MLRSSEGLGEGVREHDAGQDVLEYDAVCLQ